MFIFSNSLKDGIKSNEQSGEIVDTVIEIVDPEHKVPYDDWNFIVRKSAHVIEFCVLGIFLCGLRISILKTYGNNFIFGDMFLALFIAVCDEFIQSFTDRTSAVSDVLIDFAGAVFGIFLCALVWFVIFKLICRSKAKKLREEANAKKA